MTESQPPDPKDWIVVQSRAVRIALKDDDPFTKWYPEGKVIARGLSKTEAIAVSYFPERSFTMTVLKDMVAEYNKLTGGNIKRFTNRSIAEKRLAAARAKSKPKSTAERVSPIPFTKVTAYEQEGKRMNSASQRKQLYDEVIRLGPKNVPVDALVKKFPDFALPVLRKLQDLGWVELV